MFRKSHLLPTTSSSFNTKKQLTKSDFKIYSWGALVTIWWSKTIQFRERVVDIPLTRIPGSPLCPTSALYPALSFTAPVSSRDQQAFNGVDQSFHTHTFTYNSFVEKLRHHLSMLGLDPNNYAGHSFRREGASFAYLSEVPIEMIKTLGDWRSDTVLLYLTMPLSVRLHSTNMLCKAILSHYPTPSCWLVVHSRV